MEFLYATRRKPGRIIAVVLESKLRDTSLWTGPVGMSLGGNLYVDMSGDMDDKKYFNSAVRSLHKTIENKTQGASLSLDDILVQRGISASNITSSTTKAINRSIPDSFTGVLGNSSKKLVLEVKNVYNHRNAFFYQLSCENPAATIMTVVFPPFLLIAGLVQCMENGCASRPTEVKLIDIKDTAEVDYSKYHLYKKEGNIYIRSDNSPHGILLPLDEETFLCNTTYSGPHGHRTYVTLRLISV